MPMPKSLKRPMTEKQRTHENARRRELYARRKQVDHAPVVEGVGPDAPVVMTEQGGKHSDSPYRLDVVPPKALLAIAAVLKEGLAKYGLDNWRGISQREHLNHALVHVYAHLAGDQSDEHLAHAACRLLFALET